MKKFSRLFIIIVACVLLLPFSVSASDSYTVDNLDIIADVRSDGSVLMTEEWTITFRGEADSFTREIVVPENVLETFSSVSDVSVSVDGNGCNFDNDGTAVSGTYNFIQSEDRYVIVWNNRAEDSTHVFSLRYVLNSAVRLYNDEAYFSCTAVNGDSGLVCRNVGVEVRVPGESFSEDYTILESGTLAGKKTDGAVLFSAYNTAGEVKVSLKFPPSLFETEKLVIVEDDRTVAVVLCCVLGVISAALCVFIVYYALHYRRFFRKSMEKKCRRKTFDESAYSVRDDVLRRISAAKILNIVTEKTVCDADRFIVGFLELVNRGYITVASDGFVVNKKSDSDISGRQHDRCDLIIMDFFGSDEWQKSLEEPEKFYEKVQEYNRKLGFVNPFGMFIPEKRKLMMHCFEMKLSASGHEFVTPEEISDDFIRGGKYAVSDLVVSVLNEYSLSGRKGFVKPDTSKYSRNMFMLREIYEKGRRIYERREAELLMQKKNRKKRPVTDDDFDSE